VACMQPNHVLELLMVEGLWIGWNVYSIYIVVSYAAALRSNDPEIESTIHPMVHSMDEPTAGPAQRSQRPGGPAMAMAYAVPAMMPQMQPVMGQAVQPRQQRSTNPRGGMPKR